MAGEVFQTKTELLFFRCLHHFPREAGGKSGLAASPDAVTELIGCEWTGASFTALLSWRGSACSSRGAQGFAIDFSYFS